MTYKALHNRLNKIAAVTGASAVDELERERRERDSRRSAYEQSPAGAEIARHLAGMARAMCVAISYEQHPEAYHDSARHFARPRFTGQPCEHGEHCGGIPFGWCSCGMTSEEIGADFMALIEESQRQADEWAANGAPGAPAWYGQHRAERQV